MTYANNPAYQLAAQQDEYRVYIPTNPAEGYHMSRYVEATNQQIYAGAGATREVLDQVMDELIVRCNNQNDLTTLRTDVAALANSIKYRLKYPIDQHCSLRMGAILSFLEYETGGKVMSEDPSKAEIWWINKKVELALTHPDLYTFFLSWGVTNTPQYDSHLDTLKDSDYFINRMEAIKSLLPQPVTASSRT